MNGVTVCGAGGFINNSRSRVGKRLLGAGTCVSGITGLLLTNRGGVVLSIFVALLIGMTVAGAWHALPGALARCARSILEAADMEQTIGDQASKAYLSGKEKKALHSGVKRFNQVRSNQ